MPLPQEVAAMDGFKGKIFAGYAKTAEATSRITSNLQENPGIQNLGSRTEATLQAARSSFSSFKDRVRRSIAKEDSTPAATAGAFPTAAVGAEASPSASASSSNER